eukprot:9100776-Alexandrium_andersonii.AAC.1
MSWARARSTFSFSPRGSLTRTRALRKRMPPAGSMMGLRGSFPTSISPSGLGQRSLLSKSLSSGGPIAGHSFRSWQPGTTNDLSLPFRHARG